MNKIIKKLIKEGTITKSQGRGIEFFVYGTLFSLVIGLIDGAILIMNGQLFDITVFLTTFATTTGVAIMGGFRKHLRDMQKALDA